MANPKSEISIKAKHLLGVEWCSILALWFGMTAQGMRQKISRENPAGIHELLNFVEDIKKNKKLY